MLGHTKIYNELTRLADEGELKHGYMFFGPEGVGKKFVALKLAGHLEHGALESDKVLSDATVISPDGNSIGIDAVRSIRNFLSQKPNISQRRTIIIDNGELLTEEAGNALLKIAEEPPSSSLLILLVRDPEQIGPTLASRFEKIYFTPVPQKEIEEWLVKEKVLTKDKALKIAKIAYGRPGLATAMLENNDFKELHELVKKFMDVKPAGVKPFLKAMLEDEEFNLNRFLDALILEISWEPKKNLDLWHKVLELRHTTEYFSLSPRIQLENLHKSINK